MNTKLSDKDLVQAVLAAYHFTHQNLADILLISRVSLTNLANGKTTLRTQVRGKLESMLADAERQQES